MDKKNSISTKEDLLHKLGAVRESDSAETKTMQIKIINKKNGDNKIISPIIYQSCMNPDEINIYPLQIKLNNKSGENPEIIATTRYESIIFDWENYEIFVSPWEAKIHKTECIRCENCGRCGW